MKPSCCVKRSLKLKNPTTIQSNKTPINMLQVQKTQNQAALLETIDFVKIPSGSFLMGTDSPEGFPNDGEGPARQVELTGFRMSRYPITNMQFAQFIEATGYITEAEHFGWSYVFSSFVSEDTKAKHCIGAPQTTPWWLAIEGAYWAKPEGPDSHYSDRENHPVVHVSWNDAIAFCQWIGARLPTEAEWEYAARGGLVQKRYPWGDELTPNKVHQCNIWQGKFPIKNHGLDGFIGTAPVHSYAPNGYGLYQMSGNVWEWCADSFDPKYHTISSSRNPLLTRETGLRSMRGGSYLCHRDYCNRYRVAARNSNTPDSTSGHCGFRVVITE